MVCDFDCVQRKPVDAITKKSYKIIVNGYTRGREGPKVTWDVVVKKYMNLLSLTNILPFTEQGRKKMITQPTNWLWCKTQFDWVSLGESICSIVVKIQVRDSI